MVSPASTDRLKPVLQTAWGTDRLKPVLQTAWSTDRLKPVLQTAWGTDRPGSLSYLRPGVSRWSVPLPKGVVWLDEPSERFVIVPDPNFCV